MSGIQFKIHLIKIKWKTRNLFSRNHRSPSQKLYPSRHNQDLKLHPLQHRSPASRSRKFRSHHNRIPNSPVPKSQTPKRPPHLRIMAGFRVFLKAIWIPLGSHNILQPWMGDICQHRVSALWLYWIKILKAWRADICKWRRYFELAIIEIFRTWWHSENPGRYSFSTNMPSLWDWIQEFEVANNETCSPVSFPQTWIYWNVC
jgi:hypothetical protein